MIRSQWQGSLVALIILGIPQFCCEYKLLCLRSVSTHSGGSSRFCTWSSSLHHLHHPHSSLISESSCCHHLYADDTQLFISFAASDLSANIVHLQATIDLVSEWMSSNLLSLNQAKTEVLLIGLSAQLSKIADPTLLMPSNVAIVPADSARNLGVIFDSTLSMSHHISPVSKACFSSIRDLRRMRNTLDFTTAHTIATSYIHAKLDYCNSLFLNLP